MKPHHEPHPDGTTQGLDPRKLSQTALTTLGLERMSRGDAIRAKCLDCCAGSPAEVRRCSCIDCALWAFRMGTDPWRDKREMTEEQRAAAAERLSRGRLNRPAPDFSHSISNGAAE